MQLTTHFTSIALLTAAISTPVLAADHEHKSKHHRPHATDMRAADGFDNGMKVVPHNAERDAPGYGWRYFSDPQARRAVVISPQGDYYYSHRGRGLHWIAAEQG